MTAAAVIVPERKDYTGAYPVLYLLHGLGGDYAQWLRETNIERYVRELPLIVVLPAPGEEIEMRRIVAPPVDLT